MASTSSREDWQVNAKVYHDRVEEIHYITDPVKNIRQQPKTVVWQFEKLLGRGGCGEVRLEREPVAKKLRAVKRIPTTEAMLSSSDWGKELGALIEFSRRKHIETGFFISFQGWFRDSYAIYLIMEYIELGDLEKNVFPPGNLPEAEAQDITKQILQGLNIMHDQSFAHRDLKPKNILVVHGPPTWWIKLADFGLSKKLTDSTAFNTIAGTQSYMAPEVSGLVDPDPGNNGYSNAVDLWSLGCIAHWLVCGSVPFPQPGDLRKFCEEKSQFRIKEDVYNDPSQACRDFIAKLLVVSPRHRISAKNALAETWISSGMDSKLTDISSDDFENTKYVTSGRRMSAWSINSTPHDGLKTPSIKSVDKDAPGDVFAAEESEPAGNAPAVPSRDAPPVPSRDAPAAPSRNASTVPSRDAPSISAPSINAPSSESTPPSETPPGEQSSKVSFMKTMKMLVRPSKGIEKRLKPPALDDFTGVQIMLFSPKGTFLATCSSHGICVWNARTSARLHYFRRNATASAVLAFSADEERLASVSKTLEFTAEFQVWDVRKGVMTHRVKGDVYQSRYLAFSPNGQILISASADTTIRLWNLRTCTILWTLENLVVPTDNAFTRHITTSRDGKKIASAARNMLQLGSLETGQMLWRVSDYARPLRQIAISPDSSTVAALDATRIYLCDTTSGAVKHTIQQKQDINWLTGSISFSTDGKDVVSCGEKAANFWDLRTGICTQSFLNDKAGHLHVAWTSSGEAVIFDLYHQKLRIWGVESCEIRGELPAIKGSLMASSRSGMLAVYGKGGEIWLWDLAMIHLK